jgi:hypothetical protein
MKLALILIGALSTSANSSPFYFQTGFGTSSSATFGGGVTLFSNDRFGCDVEIGYTHIGTTKGKPILLADNEHFIIETVIVEPIQDPIPTQTEEPVNLFIDIPIVEDPVAEEPIVKEPIIEPPIVTIEQPIVIDDPPQPLPDPVIVDIDIGPALRKILPQAAKLPGNVQVNGKTLKQYIPKYSTDLTHITIHPTLKLGNFLQLRLKMGVEKKTIDGEIQKMDKGSLLEWNSDEKFSDDEVSLLLGIGAVFRLTNKPAKPGSLAGFVRADYHDLNNSVKNSELNSEDWIVSAGLRFGF